MVGDVVLAPLPFTDLSEIKVRPTVVVADVGTQDWILCQITSRSPAGDRYIPIGPTDMRRGRLRRRSWVRPDRLYTVNERVFRHQASLHCLGSRWVVARYQGNRI